MFVEFLIELQVGQVSKEMIKLAVYVVYYDSKVVFHYILVRFRKVYIL